jgi:hypothetical protein
MLLDEPVGLERPEQAVNGSLGEPEALRKLAYAQASRARGKRLQNANRAVDGLDHAFCSFMVVECCSTL